MEAGLFPSNVDSINRIDPSDEPDAISPSSPAYNVTGIADFSVSSPTESNQHMFPIITCTRYARKGEERTIQPTNVGPPPDV
jgi:hypothetical protein